MFATLARITGWLSAATAMLGGIVLLVVTVMICVSITGRYLASWPSLAAVGFGPITGDYELVEMGVGFAVFASLPYCLFTKGNATVDLFAASFAPSVLRVIELVSDLLALTIASVLGWTLWQGTYDKFRYVETSFILQFPGWFEPVFGLSGAFQVWIGYALALFGCAVFFIVACFCVLRSALALTGDATTPVRGSEGPA